MPAGEALGPVTAISPPVADANVGLPQVGLDDDGDSVFVWERSETDRVYARSWSAGGVLDDTDVVSASNSNGAALAVDTDGDAIIGWLFHNGTGFVLKARPRSFNGALGDTRTIAVGVGAYDLATDHLGTATFTWDQGRAFAKTLTVGGALGATRALSPVGEIAGWTRIDVNPSGSAAVAFTLPDEFGNDQVHGVFGP
jgi:hypothetical protein